MLEGTDGGGKEEGRRKRGKENLRKYDSYHWCQRGQLLRHLGQLPVVHVGHGVWAVSDRNQRIVLCYQVVK